MTQYSVTVTIGAWVAYRGPVEADDYASVSAWVAKHAPVFRETVRRKLGFHWGDTSSVPRKRLARTVPVGFAAEVVSAPEIKIGF